MFKRPERKTVRVQIMVTPTVDQQLSDFSVRNDVSKSEVGRIALESFLSKNETVVSKYTQR